MIGSHDVATAKSVGILNAYGELAMLTPQDQENVGGISATINSFHRREQTQHLKGS